MMAGSATVGKAIREELSKTLRGVMLLAADNVTNATPVDTGHAASNWILSTRHPYTGVDGSRVVVSTSAQEAGIAKIDHYDVGRDGPIYLRNNVLYLQYLDQGHSQQAPAGFVAIALMGAVRRAPRGRKQSVRRTLRAMAKSAYIKGI